MFLQIFGTVFIIVGVAIVLFETFKRMGMQGTAEGTIVNVEMKYEYFAARAKEKRYYPVYEYVVDGEVYHGHPIQCSKMENWYQIGQKAVIKYKKSDPEVMVAKNYVMPFVTGSIFTIVGIAFFVIWFIIK